MATDVRGPELHAAGDVPGARNLPHRRIAERNLGPSGDDVLFVLYCGGPQCKGGRRSAFSAPRPAA